MKFTQKHPMEWTPIKLCLCYKKVNRKQSAKKPNQILKSSILVDTFIFARTKLIGYNRREKSMDANYSHFLFLSSYLVLIVSVLP